MESSGCWALPAASDCSASSTLRPKPLTHRFRHLSLRAFAGVLKRMGASRFERWLPQRRPHQLQPRPLRRRDRPPPTSPPLDSVGVSVVAGLATPPLPLSTPTTSLPSLAWRWKSTPSDISEDSGKL